MSVSETSVLIVGAGPVGMMGAILLTQLGVNVRLIERRKAPSTAPAAHVVNARTFEICRLAGVDMGLIEKYSVDPVDGGQVVWWTRLGDEAVSTLPFEVQGSEALEYTPTPLRNLGQHNFESVLRAKLAELGTPQIEWGKEWQGQVQGVDGVVSSVKDIETGEVEEIHSQFLVGSDGAGSRVRKNLRIEMDGPPKIRSFVMVHFEADLRELVKGNLGILHWLMDPEQKAGGFIAHEIDREWVLMLPFDDQVEALSDYTPSHCEDIIHAAIGAKLSQPIRVIQVSSWNMSAQIARNFRDNKVFLAGDAAHRFPPAGGLGLNSGVQDIHGLVWRFAAVLQGWAPETILDSYETERREVARHNTEQSVRNAQKLIEIPQALGTDKDRSRARMEASLSDPVKRKEVVAAIQNQAEHFDMLGLQLGYRYDSGAVVADDIDAPEVSNPVREYAPTTKPGARLPHVWVERSGDKYSTLDLIKPGAFTLLTSNPCSEWDDAARAIKDIPIQVIAFNRDVKAVGSNWADVSEIGDSGALLIRPDQHVGWRAVCKPENTTAALRSALKQIVGEL